jgi:ParB/RepB/Spo0J family partition protein
MQDHLRMIRVSDIKPSPNNPRKQFDPAWMADLVASVKEHGVVQPILVRIIEDGFELIAGERRWRAATEAQLEGIPAMVVEATEQEALELSIIENLQRRDITAMEEADGFQRWLTLSGEPIDKLVEKVSKSRSYVYGTLQLLKLSDTVAERVRSGELNRSIALMIARVNDKAKQDALCRKVLIANELRTWEEPRPMTVREAQQFLHGESTRSLKEAVFMLDAEYGDLTPCDRCPKRSCNDMLLLAEVENDPDVCSDIECFKLKEVRHVEPRAAKLREQGITVLVGDTVPKGYRALTEHISSSKGYKSIRDVLGKKLLPKPPVMFLATEVESEPIQVISQKDLNKILKDNDLMPARSGGAANYYERDKKLLAEWHARLKYIAVARERIAKALMDAVMAPSITIPWETLAKAISRYSLSAGVNHQYRHPTDYCQKSFGLPDLTWGDICDLPSFEPVQHYLAAVVDDWIDPEAASHYWPEHEERHAMVAALGFPVEVTVEDRDQAEQRWPSPPPPETPASAFKKAFAGDKIRTPSKKTKKAATGEKPKASKEEVAAKLKEQLQAVDDAAAGQGQDDSTGAAEPLSQAWPWPGDREDPHPAGQTSDSAFEWDPVTGQRRPRGTVSSETEVA